METSTSNEKWIKFCESRNMRLVRFSCDVSTRWNSKYKLLCQSDEYKELLCDFIYYNVSSIILYHIQWNIYTKIYQLLKVFNDVTNTLSGVYYLITNLFIIETLNLVGAFDEYMSHPTRKGRHVTTAAYPWVSPNFPRDHPRTCKADDILAQ